MTSPHKQNPASLKVREHRERLRRQGLRPVQFWVPDVNLAEFKAEASRQSRLVAQSPKEADDQAFIDSVSAWTQE